MKNYTCDVLILGAGLAAATAAAESGANVIVLEKRRVAGGNASMAEGFFAAESPVQERNMVDARRDELFRKALDYYHWSVNPRILRAYIDKSADTVRWLEGKGFELAVAPTLRNQTPLVWHVLPKRGKAIIKKLLTDCTHLGAEVFYGATPKKIWMKSGAVQGVIAEINDKEIRFTAKTVIVATGGFGGNREMLQKSFPFNVQNLQCNGLPHMGEGILMAREAGAAGTDSDNLIGGGPCLPKMRGWAGSAMYLTALAEEPNVVWINKKGERFVDECVTFNPFEAMNPLLNQPDLVTYSLLDARIKQLVIEEGIIRGVGIYFMPPRTRVPELDKMLQNEASHGAVKIADNWGDIARWMNITPGILKTTIKEYNSSCAEGYDPIFNKDRRYLQPLNTPPFYAIRGYPFFMTTIGGIKINQRMEVLNHQDTTITGLYAAGMNAGGWVSHTYCGHLAGSGFGFALNSGRIAGENAARYTLD